MKVIKWINEKEVHDTLKQVYDKQWEIYSYIPVYEELPDKDFDMAVDALIKELAENKYIICGDTHQYCAIPVFDDNKYLILSQRRWAEIMAEAANIAKEFSGKFTYLDFYLASFCPIDENIPNKK